MLKKQVVMLMVKKVSSLFQKVKRMLVSTVLFVMTSERKRERERLQQKGCRNKASIHIQTHTVNTQKKSVNEKDNGTTADDAKKERKDRGGIAVLTETHTDER